MLYLKGGTSMLMSMLRIHRRRFESRGASAGSRRAWAPWLAALALAVSVGAVPARAGAGLWTATGGPFGGFLYLLTADPTAPGTLYAAVGQSGVFKSVDDGATWAAVRVGLPAATGPAILALDPHHPQTLVAAYSPGAVRTDDGGKSWTLQKGGPFASVFGAIAFSAGDPARAYATSFDGFFSSADGGLTWQLVAPAATLHFSLGSGLFLSIDPRDSAHVFAGVDQLLMESRDGGATWTPCATGLTDPDEPIGGLLFDTQVAERIFLWSPLGVLRSDDGGATFRPTGLAAVIDAANGGYMFGLVETADGARFYAGVASVDAARGSVYQIYERDAGQAQWRPVGPPLPFAATLLALDPLNPRGLLAGTVGKGLARSADDGLTWTTSARGLQADSIFDLVADPSHADRFYAVDAVSTLWRTVDGGASWTALADGIVPPLAIDPRQPRTLYAGGPSRSDDGGLHWRGLLPADLSHCQFEVKLAIDPLADQTLYLLMQGSNTIGCHDDESSLYKSVDGGRHWAGLGAPTTALSDVVAAGGPKGSFVYLLDYQGVLRSTDGGKTWRRSLVSGQPSHLAVSPDGRVLYVDADVLWRSLDAGGTWTPLPPVPFDVSSPTSLAVDPHTPSILYGAGDNRFFRSLDAGATWSEHSAGLRWSVLDGPLAVDPFHPGRVLAGSSLNGVVELQLPPTD
jgi:photosystem II stability/assembly factor-like uncharacterized protein